MNTLKQVKVGQTCTVKRVHGEGALRRNYGYGYYQGC